MALDLSSKPRFQDQIAVVTGGAAGIGAEIARRLVHEGARVWVADLNAEAAREAILTAGAEPRAVDVRSRADVRALIQELPRSPDVLITSAGGAARCPALEVDEALFMDTMSLNAGGFWRSAQEAAIRARREGTRLRVVHIASSLHRGPAPGLSHFAAAKAASLTLVRCMANELGRDGIRVNAVVPGPVQTTAAEAAWGEQPGLARRLRERLPLGVMGVPGDVAAAALWLASSEAEWVTGIAMSVDGGWDVSA